MCRDPTHVLEEDGLVGSSLVPQSRSLKFVVVVVVFLDSYIKVKEIFT